MRILVSEGVIICNFLMSHKRNACWETIYTANSEKTCSVPAYQSLIYVNFENRFSINRCITIRDFN